MSETQDSDSGAQIQGYTKERLYELIPAVYRQRDSKLGKPLEALIDVIAKQVAAIEKDIGGLYDNWFIETCDEWVTSYIAGLVGARTLGASRVSSATTTEKVSQRAYVANTIGYRRRKGTVLMLEELAGNVTQWGAKAVEFFKLLETTQNLNHLRLGNYRTPDLRDVSTLDVLNTPFDSIAHSAEVRRIRSNRGLYNIPNVGIFLWRLQAFPSYNTHASPYFDPADPDKTSTKTFRFSPLGYDLPIFNSAEDDPEISELAQEDDLPLPIRRRALYDLPDKYYGNELSVFIRVKYAGESQYRDILARDIQVCNLKKWGRPCTDQVAIDPEMGRISLPKKATDVRVIYHYGFSAKIGGGFYKRPPPSGYDALGRLVTISKDGTSDYTAIEAAIEAWRQAGYGNIIFEIRDSEIYDKALMLSLPVNCQVHIVAAAEQRPILRSIRIQGESGSSLTLDGLWFNNPSSVPVIKIKPGDMALLTIRHCTLVPGRNTLVRKVGVGMNNYIRRSICTWDKITTSKDNSDRLKNFLKKNFASWITESMSFAKSGETLTIASGSNSIKVTLDPDGTSANVDVVRDGGGVEKNVYEFIVITEDGKKNLYIKGGNDDLQVVLDRSITGRVNILDSLIFTWDRIPDELDDSRFLRKFLKSNFYLPWLTKDTPFENDGTTIKAKSGNNKNFLSIKLEKSKAVLEITNIDSQGNPDKDTYEFLVQDNRVYSQSEAHLSATDSIIDGKGNNEAIEVYSASLENTTVFGKTRVNKLQLASNMIFTDIVTCRITQEGCVRFSYIPPGSKTPQRYMCQPSEAKEDAAVQPGFTSEVYGDPGYAQLHRSIAREIFEGADNAAEMGAFNHLFQPQRISDLKSSLDEYLRFGIEAGVFLVT